MSAIRRRHAAPPVPAELNNAITASLPSPRRLRGEDLTNQRLASVFLALIAAALYANTLTAEMCYDDTFAVLNNKDVSGVNPISALWFHDFWGQNITKIDSHKSYRPFTVLTFRLNHYFSGLAPMSYHAVNVALHAVVTVLAFNLFMRISTETATSTPGLEPGFLVAFIAALLFALHPVHVEAVAGVVGRAELLCAIFYIVAILLYRYAVSLTRTRWHIFPLIIACYVSATLAKETGYTMLGVLLVYDIFTIGVPIYYWPVRGNHSLSISLQTAVEPASINGITDKNARTGALRAFLIRASIILVLGAAYLYVRKVLTVHFVVHNFRRVENPIAFQHGPMRWLSIIYLHAKYATLLFFPYHLSPDWSFNCVPLVEEITDPRNLLSLALYLFLLIFSLILLYKAQQRTSQVLLFYLALTAAPFVPAANIFFYVGTFIGERLLYIPSLGFCYLFTNLLVYLANAVAKWYRRRSKSRRLLRPADVDVPLEAWQFVAALAIILAPFLIYYSLRTLSHNTVWRNEESLFQHALHVCPDSAKVQENVGVLERRKQNWASAITHFERARAIDIDLCEIDHWLGLTYLNSGEFDRALPYLRSGLGCIWCYANCFEVLQKVHETLIEKDAKWIPSWETVCDQAAHHHPDDAAPIYENLAVLHYGRNDTFSALRALTKAADRATAQTARCRVVTTAVTLCREHPTFPPQDCASLIEKSIDCEQNTTAAVTQRNGYMLWLHGALHANSSSPDLQFLWAELLAKVERAPESAPHYQASIQLFMDKNRYKEAFSVAQRAVLVHPTSCELRLLLGFLHAVHRDYERAREHLTRSTEVSCSEETRSIAKAKLTEVSALASV